MSVNVQISLPSLNEILGNIPAFSQLLKVQSEIQNFAFQFSSASPEGTTLGRSRTTINGLESLTSNVDLTSTGLTFNQAAEANVGVVRVRATVPGYSNILTNTQNSSADLRLVTGRTSLPTSFEPNEIIIANSAKSIKSNVSNITGKTPNYNKIIAATIDPQYSSTAPAAYNAIDTSTGDLTQILNQTATSVGGLSATINTSLGDISLTYGKLDNAALQVDNYIEKEIRSLTSNTIPDEDVKLALEEIADGRPEVAVQIMQPYSTVEFSKLEEDVHSIPASPTSQIGTPRGTQTIVTGSGLGTSTYSPKVIGAETAGWKGRSTPVNWPGFNQVNSTEELIAEFLQCKRPITEFVLHWTAHYLDSHGVGASHVHRDMISRTDIKFAGLGYHYIIKRDGTIERGRPLGLAGAHAVRGGHNKYSIGISFVAGYNCTSGTPNPNQYVSAASITSLQFTAFDNWCKAFYQVFPAGQGFGHNDTDPSRKVDPGFNVPEYLDTKFGKRNVIAAAQGPLSPSQLTAIV